MSILLGAAALALAAALGVHYGRDSERRKLYDERGRVRSPVTAYARLEHELRRQKGFRLPHPDPENAPQVKRVRMRF